MSKDLSRGGHELGAAIDVANMQPTSNFRIVIKSTGNILWILRMFFVVLLGISV